MARKVKSVFDKPIEKKLPLETRYMYSAYILEYSFAIRYRKSVLTSGKVMHYIYDANGYFLKSVEKTDVDLFSEGMRDIAWEIMRHYLEANVENPMSFTLNKYIEQYLVQIYKLLKHNKELRRKTPKREL